MRKLATLVAVILTGVAAAPAKAEEFWGRKIAEQPTNFIFGYGSLINTSSRNASRACS